MRTVSGSTRSTSLRFLISHAALAEMPPPAPASIGAGPSFVCLKTKAGITARTPLLKNFSTPLPFLVGKLNLQHRALVRAFAVPLISDPKIPRLITNLRRDGTNHEIRQHCERGLPRHHLPHQHG